MKFAKYWNKHLIIICMLPPILFYLVLGIIPSLLTFGFSFTNITRTGSTWNFVGLTNYRELFLLQNSRDTWLAIQRTLVFAVAVTVIKNVIALLIAVLFNNKAVRGRNFYRAITFLPSILGVTVCCYAWVIFLGVDGPAMTLLHLLDIKSAMLGSKADAFKIVIFIEIWMSVGYAMVLDIAGLQGIPNEMYEAGSIDGAGSAQQFFKITLPLLWPTISVNILLSIIWNLGVVQPILLTTGGANNTATLAMRIYNAAFGIGTSDVGGLVNPTQGYAAAQSMALFIIILFFALFTNFIMKKRENYYAK